ncbi:MAG: DedA family protein [Halothiobacillus sp.]
MSFANFSSFEQIIPFLQQHRSYAYSILFFGAFFETVIPFSLIVFGELFFLAGAILAGMEVLELWIVMTVLYTGGILGDNLSYWMGRRYGMGLFDRLQHWPMIGRLIHRENYEKGVAFFEKRGAFAVFIARLSGPLSWITPAMAGVFKLNYGVFLRFNTPAVIIGISEFIILGYFFGNYIHLIIDWLHRYGLVIGLIFVCVVGTFLVIRRYFDWRGQVQRTEAEIIEFIGRHFGVAVLIIAGFILGILYLIYAVR